MAFIEKWDSIYIPVDSENSKTYCCICGKPVQYIDVFSEKGICSFKCAKEHDSRIESLIIKSELNFEE